MKFTITYDGYWNVYDQFGKFIDIAFTKRGAMRIAKKYKKRKEKETISFEFKV